KQRRPLLLRPGPRSRVKENANRVHFEEAWSRHYTRQCSIEAVVPPPQSYTSDCWILEKLRYWSTPLAPILLKSEGLDVLELRKLNRNMIGELARTLGKQ